MEKQNKVMNIIVNCIAFAVIALFIVGMFALPPISVSAGGASESTSAYGFIDQLIETIKQLGQAEGPAKGQLIGRMISLLAFVIVFAVFAVMGVIKSIILLIKSIKAVSKPEENKPAIKSIVSFGILCLIYDTLVLGIMYSKVQMFGGSLKTSLGAGTIMILIAGLLALCAAGAYVFMSRKELPMVTRILDMVTSTFAIVSIMLMLFAPVGVEGSTMGLIGVLAARIGGLASTAIMGGTPDFLPVIMGFVGAALLFVALGFGKMVVVNGYRLLDKKDVDYPKSSIVKSSLWLGFAVIGVVLSFVFDKSYSIAIGGIMTFVFVALTLGCAIVNKVMSPKAEPKAE